jgi:eukaryotic-like serine/threonine-protein kinase
MTADRVELMLADLTGRAAEVPAAEAYLRLYTDDARFGHVFASLHERLNKGSGLLHG